MQAITMTVEQTDLYDRRDAGPYGHDSSDALIDMWNNLRASAQRLANETGETVEIYTADGNVVHAVYPTE